MSDDFHAHAFVASLLCAGELLKEAANFGMGLEREQFYRDIAELQVKEGKYFLRATNIYVFARSPIAASQ